MRIFLITDIKIVNDEWFPAYAENAHEIVHTHGGRYLSRSGNITTVEGEGLDISLFAFIEFPSMQHSESFAHNPEYAPYATARQVGSISRFHISDSSDLAGTIPYLVASLNMNSKKTVGPVLSQYNETQDLDIVFRSGKLFFYGYINAS